MLPASRLVSDAGLTVEEDAQGRSRCGRQGLRLSLYDADDAGKRRRSSDEEYLTPVIQKRAITPVNLAIAMPYPRKFKHGN